MEKNARNLLINKTGTTAKKISHGHDFSLQAGKP